MNKITLLEFPESGIKTGGDKNRDKYIPNPSTYGVGWDDTDLNSKRSLSAVLIRNRVRSGAGHLWVSWDRLSDDQINWLKEASDGVAFRMIYRDPASKTRYTDKPKMYRQASIRSDLLFVESNGTAQWSFTLEFIEI